MAKAKKVAPAPVVEVAPVAPVVETPVVAAEKTPRRATQKWATKEAMAAIQPSDRIVLLVKENPKRLQPKDRFALYFAEGGLTVAQYIEAVEAMGKAGVKGSSKAVAKADISWDVGHGFIAIQPSN